MSDTPENIRLSALFGLLEYTQSSSGDFFNPGRKKKAIASNNSVMCLPMFIGRRCEINGLVLAIALPTAVAVVVMLLCGVAFCCRRCRRKSAKTDSSGMFREIALRGPVGSTLDRKAMIDTSSESSGEHGIRNPQAFDGYQESGDVTPKKGSKKSDLSLDRSLSTGYTVPPVMIPRARQHQPHNKMNYAVYNGQVYVW